jgi:hypothetical protein
MENIGIYKTNVPITYIYLFTKYLLMIYQTAHSVINQLFLYLSLNPFIVSASMSDMLSPSPLSSLTLLPEVSDAVSSSSEYENLSLLTNFS